MVLRNVGHDLPSLNGCALPIRQDLVKVPEDVRTQLYEPLAPWQIRILRVHPSTDLRSDLKCDLLTADLIPFPGVGLAKEHKIVQYEALSYSWGYPALNKAILCNNVLLPVSETMYDALRHIRKPDSVRYLWTDVCCINQSDLAEKARQVEMMFTIFQEAIKVVAWIGTPSIEEELLFTLIDRTDQYDRVDGEVYALSKSINNHRYHKDHYDKNFALAKAAAWKVITSRAFFRRTWIRQEFFAARDLEIVCGQHVCTLPRFANVMDQLLPDLTTSGHKFVDDPDPDARAVLCYSYFRSDYEANQLHNTREANSSWFCTMMRSTLYLATLPQDKIFAVLGITKALTLQQEDAKIGVEEWDITNGLPTIDYSKSVSRVYQDFVKHTINTSCSLRCLSIFQDRNANGVDLPSWTIDLRIDVPRYLIPQQMAEWGRDFAEELREENTKQDFNLHDVLSLRGRRIAIIGADSPASNPWNKGLKRRFIGSSAPMLESCFSDSERWFPEDDNEAEGCNSVGVDSRDVPLERAFDRLRKQCKYRWMEIGKTVASVRRADWYQSGNPGANERRYIFVSELVAEGDLVVHLNGANLPFVLRKTDKAGKWRFLGPAILAVGEVTQEKPRKKGKSQRERMEVFEWAIASVDDRKSEADENFVLV